MESKEDVFCVAKTICPGQKSWKTSSIFSLPHLKRILDLSVGDAFMTEQPPIGSLPGGVPQKMSQWLYSF